MKLKSVFFTAILLLLNLLNQVGWSQDYDAVDSLNKALKKHSKPREIVSTYEELFWQYYGVYNDTALFFAKKALLYAEKTKYEKGLLAGYRLMGMAYATLSNYPEALKYQQMALAKCDVVKDSRSKANILNNLANIHYELKDYKTALPYYERSLDLCMKLKIKEGVSSCYGNIGNVYKNLKQTIAARKYYEKSMVIDKELKNYRGIANSLSNIGSLFENEKNYQNALSYYEKALHIRDSIGNTEGKASSYNSIANIYTELGDIEKSLDYYNRALGLAEETGSIDIQESCYKGLYTCYKKLGQIGEALDAFEKYDILSDSMLNSNRLDELSQLRTQFLMEQKDAEQKIKIAEINAKREVEKQAETKQRRIILISSISGILLMLIFSYFIYKRYKQSLQQQQIIESQKKLVETKNKEITDSINYAKRIQEAMLASEKEYCSFFEDAFVLFKPKDIVSGDFYWINQIDANTILFILGDCTGHGVPGGFMSVLGINLVNEIVNEKKITQPAQILNTLRENIKSALKQDGAEGTSRDGMDVAIGLLNKSTGKLTYATANRMLYVYENNTLSRHNGNKMPVGYFEKEDTFDQFELTLNKGSLVYFFTDGFVDQIGGDLGRKLKYPNFEAAIKSAVAQNKALDKQFFDQLFTDWKKHHHQVDDVCLIGMKI